MKQSYIYITLIGLLLGVALIGAIFVMSGKSKTTNDYYYIGVADTSITDEKNYVFTNYNDYYTKTNSKILTEKDFTNNNYALLSFEYDSCADTNLKLKDYKIEGNLIEATIQYEERCASCASKFMYYVIKLDKNMKKVEFKLNYEKINDANCDENASYKPLIYLYPTQETMVNVKLGKPELLTTTYPKYKDSWNVLASPDGLLKDHNGKTYYGLYWEGYNNFSQEFSDGFVVSKEDTIPFLEEKLKLLGLTDREMNEMIIYWLPKLEENEYNLIRFEEDSEIEKQMPLLVTPTPDTVIRVFMKWKGLKNKIDIEEQKLLPKERKGFTVIEWGGTIIE